MSASTELLLILVIAIAMVLFPRLRPRKRQPEPPTRFRFHLIRKKGKVNAVLTWKKSVSPRVDKQTLSINGVENDLAADVETFTIPVLDGEHYDFSLWAVRNNFLSTPATAAVDVPFNTSPEAPTDLAVVLS